MGDTGVDVDGETTQSELFERFYQSYAAYRPLKTHYISPEASAMQVGGPDPDGMLEWRFLPADDEVSEALKRFEEEIGFSFPPSLHSWFGRYHSIHSLDCDLIWLPGCPLNDPLRLLNYCQRDLGIVALRYRLIPFGGGKVMDEGDNFFFDTRVPSVNNEWPVITFDPDSESSAEDKWVTAFSSFTMMIECAVLYLETKPFGRKEHADIIDHFFEIDPDGAGSSGQRYWKSRLEDHF